MYGSAGEGWGGLGRAGEAPGRCFDVRLRIYGFTDLTPSLPLPLATPFTCIYESTSRRRAESTSNYANFRIPEVNSGRKTSVPGTPIATFAGEVKTVLILNLAAKYADDEGV